MPLREAEGVRLLPFSQPRDPDYAVDSERGTADSRQTAATGITRIR
jgi:hypothetical protein